MQGLHFVAPAPFPCLGKGHSVACSTGCPTQDHPDWGSCVRSKRLQTADVTAHQFNTSLYHTQDEYRRAREDGLQPENVTMSAINEARRLSDALGKPYRADKVA